MAQALSTWLKYIPEVQHPKKKKPQNKNLKGKKIWIKLTNLCGRADSNF